MLGGEYLGTIIRGGCNELARNPGAHRKILSGIEEIGRVFGATGKFNKEMLDKYSRPEVQSRITAFAMRFLVGGINRFYWDRQLKANGALDKTYDKPYAA